MRSVSPRVIRALVKREPDGSRNPFDRFIISKTPAARWGDPEDLMGPTVFLASDASAYITGQNLVVDGGFSVCR